MVYSSFFHKYKIVEKEKSGMRDGKIVAAVTGMDHGHINGMTEGIGEAGAVIKWAYDPDTEKTGRGWGGIRRAQDKICRTIKNTSLTVITDESTSTV